QAGLCYRSAGLHDLVVASVGRPRRNYGIRGEQTDHFVAPLVPHGSSEILGNSLPTRDLDGGQKKTTSSRRQKQFVPTLPQHNGAIGLSVGLLCRFHNPDPSSDCHARFVLFDQVTFLEVLEKFPHFVLRKLPARAELPPISSTISDSVDPLFRSSRIRD